MGTPLGPLMANAFMCHVEEQLTTNLGEAFPSLYTRYVTDTLVATPNVISAKCFPLTLVNLHTNTDFTMELSNKKISFIGFETIKNGTTLDTRVYC